MAQVPNPKLSAEDERKQVVASWGKPMVKGETWYVLSRKWLQQFCDYTGFNAERPNEIGKAGAPRPGPIDNKELLVEGSTKELKKELTVQDYELVHTATWNLLVSWYGGGPALPRFVIVVGLMQVERIELYPVFLQLLQVDRATGEPVALANAASAFSAQQPLLELLMAHQPGFDGKAPDKQPVNMRVWIRDDGKRNTTDEVLSKAAELQAAAEAGKSSDDKQKDAAAKQEADKKSGIPSGWKLVHGDTYGQKLETFEFKADTELMFEYRPNMETQWARRTGKLNWREFEMNDIIDCADHRKVYFESLIRDIKGEKLLIHFINWSTKWDEWILKTSDRLAPRNHITTGPYTPKEEAPASHNLNAAGPPPEKGAVGLRNLGNTCFMNSTLQCLSNTPGLTQFFVEDKYIGDLNTNNPLGWGGKIAVEYAKLIKDIWSGRYTTVAPRALKDAIGEYQPRFSGYQQHDSSELLSFLLDGLHEDLNRLKKKPATQPVDSDGRPDPVVATDSWYRHLQRNQSIIVDTCQGQLKSRVVCPECKRESITFDPFMFLSVPLPEANDLIQPVTFLPAANGAVPKVHNVKCSKAGDVAELKEKLGKATNTNALNFIVAEVWNNRFYKIFANDYPLMRIGARDNIWIYECPPPAPAPNTPPDAPKEEWIQAQLAHFTGSGQRFLLHGTPTIINLKNSLLKKYPNAELHALCKAATAPFIKNAKWEDKEEPAYEIFLCDKGGKETREVIPKDAGFTDLIKNGGFAICLRWPDAERWAPMPVAEAAGEDGGGKKGITLDDCMEAFTKEEVLRKTEAWYCSKCKKHHCATKKFDLWKTPDVLILHLKRFSYNHLWRDKIGTFVDFPVEGLDIRSWCVNKEEKDTIYDLYAVSNHFGGLGGGHYTAYGKNILDGKWYNLDDSSVQPLGNPNQVRTAAAYVLFYRRRGRTPGATKHTLESTLAQAAALGMTTIGGQPVPATAAATTAAATTSAAAPK